MATVDLLNRVRIKAMLIGDRRVGDLYIDVDVQGGTATLRGDVESEEQKHIAEELAREIEGIMEVDNELKVVPEDEESPTEGAAPGGGQVVIPGPGTTGPGAGAPAAMGTYEGAAVPPHWILPTEEHGINISALTEEVERKIAEDGRITSKNIHVSIDDGIAHLQGTVDSLEESYLVQDAAESVPGIKEVKNDLEIEEGHSGHTCNCGRM